MTSVPVSELEHPALSDLPGYMLHANLQDLSGDLVVSHTEGEELEQPVLPPRQKFKDPSWMTRNAGKRINLIAHWEVKSSFEPVKSTGGYKFLCGYSWKQTDSNTIYVPGTPPKWKPPPLPKQLTQDTGFHWCDQHGHRVPRHQFEPVFQALAVWNPTVRFNDVDIAVNRNTLQKLFNFASFKRGRAFHVDLDVYSGYGRNFEEAFTTEDPQLPQSEGHHRIIRYNFGGLHLVVRIEVDGYYSGDEDVEDSPDELFRSVLYTTKQTTIQHHSPHPMATIPQGTTRGLEGLIQAADVIRIKQNEFEEWEDKNQKHLLRLAWFLSQVRRITVEKTSHGAAVLVRTEKGAPLQVYEAKSSFGALPKEIVAGFWD